MDLTTELLDNAAFREAKRGGYNTQDVDEFIEQVKAEYLRHDALVREARQRIEAAEARIADAERRAAETAGRSDTTNEVEDTLKRTLVLAQRTADAAVKEAEEQASRTLSAAQDQATRMLADAQEATARARAEAESDARRAQEEARTRVLGELRDLEAARDQLHTDVDTLERHLEEQRDRVRFCTRELQRLLDDPAALREMAVPIVSEVTVPVAPAVGDLALTPVAAPQAGLEAEEAWMEPGAPAASPAYADPVDDRVTQTNDLVPEPAADDDAYLAELRKAMNDDAPLGPREEGDIDVSFDAGTDESRSRFGRRR